MSGGSFTLDPATGKRVRVGEAHKTPTRAERRALAHAAEAAAVEAAPADKAPRGSGRRRSKAVEPPAVDAPIGDTAGAGDLSTKTEE